MWALDNTNQYIRLLWAHYLCHESCWFSESDREILTNIYMTSSISLTSLIPQPSSWQSTMAYCKKVSCEVSHHVLFKLEPHGFHKQKWCSWLKEIACIVRDPIKIHTHTIPKSVYEKWHFLYRKHHDYSVKCKETRRLLVIEDWMKVDRSQRWAIWMEKTSQHNNIHLHTFIGNQQHPLDIGKRGKFPMGIKMF